ncbi:homeobox protein prospero [Ixodes scapularis]|uniref:homeobox protein prospero n=1 Tax=Ixodes scapularis TaxID=6945 RepID=UPI001A9FE12E|nr:homeobox protein prospero [Ixodes scapularis]XP_040064731.1 homeobox protein prospero [Ixodes scapularis]
MSSEEDSAGESLSFARAKAKRARQPRVDAGEPRASSNGAASSCASAASSLDLRSPLRNGFMSDELAEAERGAHLLRDILQRRREDVDQDDDEEEDDEEDGARGETPPAGMEGSRASDDEADAKRARVENIVSNMLRGGGDTGSVASVPTVNGCKKRKLYQPQQALSGPDEDTKLRRTDREAFRQDLLRLKSEVATMQQRYDEMRSEDEDMDDAVSEDSVTAAVDDDGRETLLTTPPSELSTDAPRSSPLRDIKPPVRDVESSPEPRNESPSRLAEVRQSCIVRPVPPAVMCQQQDMDRLVSAIKHEVTDILPRVIDGIVWRFVRQQDALPTPTTVARRLDGAPPCRDDQRSLLTQMLDRKSPRTKVLDRSRHNGHGPRSSPGESHHHRPFFPGGTSTPLRSGVLRGTPPAFPEPAPEQTEAMSLVVATRKKRHKVTDTRLAPRAGEACSPPKESPGFPPPPLVPVSLPTTVAIPNPSLHQAPDVFYHVDQQHAARLFEEHPGSAAAGPPPPPPGLPLMLSHSPHDGPPHYGVVPSRSPPQDDSVNGDSQGGYDSSMAMISFLKTPKAARHVETNEELDKETHFSGRRHWYLNGAGGPSSHPGGGPLTPGQGPPPHGGSRDNSSAASDSPGYKSLCGGGGGGGGGYTSTLTPMHLRKAKLMFFYVRYPSSAILKMYFPDINFNKNNTAQLVKWFSNFREFYYIQMEKYARQSVSEGVKNVEELKVSADSELLRVLNLHYNRNNHIEVPENFRYVVEQTLREFFRAIVAGKDQEQSWKKAIYKVIARLDDNVPEYFKSPNFLEQLE